MKLQPHEHELLSSNESQVVLTNIRIKSSFSEWGHAHTTYIYLEDISSIQSVYRSVIYFLVLAVICIFYVSFYSLSNGSIDGPAWLALFGSLFSAALWWYSRKRVIAIHSDGGRPIEFAASKMREEAVEDFLEQVQLAMTARRLFLSRVLLS